MVILLAIEIGGEGGGGVLLGHSLIIIKLTLGFFPKICNLNPPSPFYNYAQKSNQFRYFKPTKSRHVY